MAHPHAFDPHAFLAKIGAGRTLVSYQKHHPIFTQGEAADAVFYIQDLAGQPQRMVTATALTDGTLMRIEKPAMLRVLHAEPAFSALFMAYLLSRNSRIEADLIDHLFDSSEKRLARPQFPPQHPPARLTPAVAVLSAIRSTPIDPARGPPYTVHQDGMTFGHIVL
jgi:CRP-like cAMP-binding protein